MNYEAEEMLKIPNARMHMTHGQSASMFIIRHRLMPRNSFAYSSSGNWYAVATSWPMTVEVSQEDSRVSQASTQYKLILYIPTC